MKRTIVLGLAGVIGLLIAVRWRSAAPEAPAKHDPLLAPVVERLRAECDPDNPGSDYAWSTNAMPTERIRDDLIRECQRIGPRLIPAVREAADSADNDEMRGMLVVIAAALGDDASVLPAAHEMAWAASPAVRLSAARVLSDLRDPRTVEWFELALQDDRFVRGCGCASEEERFYPVRAVAQLALRSMGAGEGAASMH